MFGNCLLGNSSCYAIKCCPNDCRMESSYCKIYMHNASSLQRIQTSVSEWGITDLLSIVCQIKDATGTKLVLKDIGGICFVGLCLFTAVVVFELITEYNVPQLVLITTANCLFFKMIAQPLWLVLQEHRHTQTRIHSTSQPPHFIDVGTTCTHPHHSNAMNKPKKLHDFLSMFLDTPEGLESFKEHMAREFSIGMNINHHEPAAITYS